MCVQGGIVLSLFLPSRTYVQDVSSVKCRPLLPSRNANFHPSRLLFFLSFLFLFFSHFIFLLFDFLLLVLSPAWLYWTLIFNQLAAIKTCLINELKERKYIELNLESFCEYSVPLAHTQLTTVWLAFDFQHGSLLVPLSWSYALFMWETLTFAWNNSEWISFSSIKLLVYRLHGHFTPG